jgi:hypothetical protein
MAVLPRLHRKHKIQLTRAEFESLAAERIYYSSSRLRIRVYESIRD